MHIFISHSSTNSRQAQEVCGAIESSGHKCFLAPRDIRSGHEYAEEIINGIDSSDAMLLLLSQEANDSPHVLREIERAVSKKIPIMVYKLEQVQLSKSMEYFLMTHQWLNERADTGYEEIVRSINALEGREISDEKSVHSYSGLQDKSTVFRKKLITIAIAAVCFVGAIICAVLLFGGDKPAISDTQSQPQITDEVHTSDQQTASATEQTTTSAAQSTTTDAATSLSENTQPTTLPDTTEQSTTADNAASDEPAELPQVADVQLGDRIMLGEYNGEAIEWRVIDISEDGTTATVIANDILTMKAYDASEGGNFNSDGSEYYWNVPLSDIDAELQRLLRGDNRWELSNIRTWLNSDRENVIYADQAPTPQAMSENKNGYHTESGFLNGFTDEELSAIVEVQLDTNGSITNDRVYLLSFDQLKLLEEADVSIDAEPTAAAAAQDQSGWYALYSSDFGVTDHYWWLRDAEQTDGHINACEVRVVGNSYTGNRIFSDSASLEGYGVRPAMTVDLTSEYINVK